MISIATQAPVYMKLSELKDNPLMRHATIKGPIKRYVGVR
jgi:hypothetical protein